MEETTNFKTVNPNAAGIDLGAEKIFVSVDGVKVENFRTFTADYRKCISYLKEHGIKSVAMEATGVYWIAFHEMLESSGLEVCLVNPKEVRQVKGRKSDVSDCQWIQKLHSAGLLQASSIPKGKLKELRLMVRERLDIIEMGSAYVNKMQKALELMNIKLTSVISQIQGASGLRMIEAILKGERSAEKLLSLCDERIITKKGDDVIKALEGNYNTTYLFMLNNNLQMWKLHQEALTNVDQKIESLLEELNQNRPHIPPDQTKVKPIRHHKPEINDLHQKMLDAYGANVSSISGLNDYSLLRLIGETGNDLSRFPSAKHFTSWCQLSPKHKQSGSKTKVLKIKTRSQAGQIFRDAARSILNSRYIAIGAFMRKIRSKKGASIAIKAGARKIAEAYYNLLTKGKSYVEQGILAYEMKIKQREYNLIQKLALKHNLSVVSA